MVLQVQLLHPLTIDPTSEALRYANRFSDPAVRCEAIDVPKAQLARVFLPLTFRKYEALDLNTSPTNPPQQIRGTRSDRAHHDRRDHAKIENLQSH